MKKTTYIQFKIPKSVQIGQADGIVKRNLKKAITGILSSIIPKANPDFENKIDLVEKWIVELDNETGIPEREIGMDKNGRIIIKMPFKNNYGYWTDNNLLLTDFKNHFETSEISQDSFENYWSLFEKTEDFETTLTDFKIQTTGSDGGHHYLMAKVNYNGQKRDLIAYFTNKSDEHKIKELDKVKICGKIVDNGIEQSLSLLETKLLNE
ncbi:hypothetical protein [Marixanthomonas ophiurae]|uniref:Uncharacterized protein n=1 Tax=Marixanthomonas ophiurae TaxID=387659 RepID=A0A3E1Q8D4_9FLAO|nr:hypothetical protein [Marixanthomonas ophiurae]RFN58407.1 hypothetical protein DZ858_14400 [Marixanthomonas ophiurae]